MAAKSIPSFPQIIKIRASRKNEEPLITRKASKSPRRVISIPASTGRWPGQWTCEYLVSLKDLQLDDLAEDGRKDTEVFVSLSLQKHAGFGLSVDGKVVTTIARKCSSCSSPYCRTIDTSIRVWVLPDDRDDSSTELPEIGSDDPSVIYVRPGYEADLGSLVQDTIRLQTAVKETCSESCEKSEPKLHYIGDQRTASLDRRWSKLLQLRNANR
ncbi:large ribosomal RNA subunit accumulation protein YCED homolog 2, chloroplastic-like [Chenopodium quinoa]|uniref:large ribosomal RNA subunit accumulation protein YCED homolog 2, chloroplastic-like n=1 Tax=Chenopodium quinoa TaxID=63459 RepID=UPI000B76E539|nr:large ribosomal RNA subunit accumulation protein YCED homolog 2, chloroplastic-like [Chenopodium quinoa]